MGGEFRLWSRDFVLLCLANFFYFGSFYFLLPTLPQYVGVLGGSPSQVGMVMGWFTLAAVAARPYFGKMVDRYGHKRFMLLGSAFFVVFFILYNYIETLPFLYAARAAHGFAHACFMAASAAYIADIAPPQRRGEVIGIYGTSNIVAMALFPAWGTTLISATGNFNYLFSLAALAAGIALVAVVFLKEINHGSGKSFRPATTFELVRRRGVIVPSLALLGGATAYGAVFTFLPLFVPQRGIKDFGIFFTVYAISTIMSRVLVGKLSDRIGRRKLVMPFIALVVIATFLLPGIDSLFKLALIGGLFGLGFGAFMPTLNALVVDYTPPRDRGSALGFFTSFMDLGITAGAVLLGALGERFGFEMMFYLGSAIALSGLIAFAVFLGPSPDQGS
ncbi:putative MFS-type transporter YfcJ [bioreactor metagenome]|uniref:Putative MFS-type transporter YfcJ n=1 Tax=bioreactor metagenome TaxID=1076179 RepID=A0A644SVB1_9ZZZZ|nr:MFS transporter [Negativicutes bacterium]